MSTGGYYIGLDIGTTSVGFAITDENYNLIQKKGRVLWGVRLFDEAKTAADRRSFRSARRRLRRKRARLQLLRTLLQEPILALDPLFFQRLDDSFFHAEDKKTPQKYTLFTDPTFTDADYYHKYPTIYHLRYALYTDPTTKFDIRLIYLAIAHILKKRGNFLYEGQALPETGKPEFSPIAKNFFETFKKLLVQEGDGQENFDTDFLQNDTFLQKLQSIFEDRKKTHNDTKTELKTLLVEYTKNKELSSVLESFFIVILGKKKSIIDLFTKTLFPTTGIAKEEENKKEILFTSETYEATLESLTNVLTEEQITCIQAAKDLYDWRFISNLLGECETISEARIAQYEKHKTDLKQLKDLIKTHNPAKYAAFFEEDFFPKQVPQQKAAYKKKSNKEADESGSTYDKTKANYVAYIGKARISGTDSTCPAKDFFDALKKLMQDTEERIAAQNHENTSEALSQCSAILEEIENSTFLPKQTTTHNGAIPYQLHKKELKRILENASKHHPIFTADVINKIIQIMEFRIPYFVGPLNPKSDFAWATHTTSNTNSTEKIYPWNFKDKIDQEKSAEAFIQRMVRHCTYIHEEEALPKNSLLYNRYCMLNELNNLRILTNDGQELRFNEKQKQEIMDAVFTQYKTVTKKHIKDYLISTGVLEEDNFNTIEGLSTDGKCTSSFTAYHGLKDILNKDGKDCLKDHEDICEKIIYYLTVAGESKQLRVDLLKKHCYTALKELFSDNTDGLLQKLSNVSFKGWGRLSRKLLELSGKNTDDGEPYCTLIDALLKTSCNLMQLLAENSPYTFHEELKNITSKKVFDYTKVTYKDIMEDLYCSPAVKRGIWQAWLIVEELVKFMQKEPKKIFIEMPREDSATNGKRGKTTDPRKQQVEALYKEAKKFARQLDDLHIPITALASELEKRDTLRNEKVFLYFLQFGKCMYSATELDLSNLRDYDVDHIYPRSQTKDDSLNNKVLVLREKNQNEKREVYPLPENIRKKPEVRELWRFLKEKKFISEEKYKRLTRTTPLTDEELAGFINRQLVVTQQSCKVVKDLLQERYQHTRILAVRPSHIADFRKKHVLPKLRNVNAMHHAHDAYLAIVVGNVFTTKFTDDPRNFIKEKKEAKLRTEEEQKKHDERYRYDLARMYIWNVPDAWDTKSSRAIVEKTIFERKRALITYKTESRAAGELFNQKRIKKTASQAERPPLADERLTKVDMYGGYNSMSAAYFFLVEYTDTTKKAPRRVRAIQRVFKYAAKSIESNNPEESKEKLRQYCTNVLELQEPTILLEKIPRNTLFLIEGSPMMFSSLDAKNVALYPALQLHLDEKWYLYVHTIEQYLRKVEFRLGSKKFSEEEKRDIYKKELEELNNWEYRKRSSGKYYDPMQDDRNILVKGMRAETLKYGIYCCPIEESYNEELYDILLGKLTNTIYKKRLPENTIQSLVTQKDFFAGRSAWLQACMLQKVLKLFAYRPQGGLNIPEFETTITAQATRSVKKNTFIKGRFVDSKDQVQSTNTSSSFYLIQQSVTGIYENRINLNKLLRNEETQKS